MKNRDKLSAEQYKEHSEATRQKAEADKKQEMEDRHTRKMNEAHLKKELRENEDEMLKNRDKLSAEQCESMCSSGDCFSRFCLMILTITRVHFSCNVIRQGIQRSHADES